MAQKINPNVFGQKIRELLEKNNIKTQKEFAEDIKYSENAVSDWVNGVSQPKWINQIATIFEYFYNIDKDFNPLQLFGIDATISTISQEALKVEIEKERVAVSTKYEQKIKQLKKYHDSSITEFKNKYKLWANQKVVEDCEKRVKESQQRNAERVKKLYANIKEYKDFLLELYDDFVRDYEDPVIIDPEYKNLGHRTLTYKERKMRKLMEFCRTKHILSNY